MIKFHILAGSEFHKTGAMYENAIWPYVLRLRFGVTSRDLLDKRNSPARTYRCNTSH